MGAAFGSTTGALTGWLYYVAGAVGQTIVPLTGGYYLAEAAGWDDGWAYAIAGAILAIATGANLFDLRVGGRIQLALAAGVGALLALTVLVAVPRMELSCLEPFAPHGWGPVAIGVVILFYAFAGWEAVAHLAGEFRDPDRDLPRAVGATVVIISTLYLGIAVAVVLTGTYGEPGVDHVAIGLLLQDGFGRAAAAVAAAGAVVISLGTTNAFIAGVSRLGASLARERWLPSLIGRIDARGVPVAAVLSVGAIAASGLLLAAAVGWGTQTLVVVPAVLVVAVYLLAGVAGVRLLRGAHRVAAIVTVALTGLVLPSVVAHLAIVAIVAVIAVGVRLACRRGRLLRSTL